MIHIEKKYVFRIGDQLYQAPSGVGLVIEHYRLLMFDTILMLLPNPNTSDDRLNDIERDLWARGDVWSLLKVEYSGSMIRDTHEVGIYLGESNALKALKEYHG